MTAGSSWAMSWDESWASTTTKSAEALASSCAPASTNSQFSRELPPAGTAAAASTEGCVYRDVFLHPGARTSLGLAVADYLDASAGGILNMKDYVNRRRRR